ncbi:MAG: rhodanese-like domain-containing protein [Deltaproteobacteria bacterium]|nr:MAG: rhodanese-like domain-containing protein [Deltaproteobacteria bacterium]
MDTSGLAIWIALGVVLAVYISQRRKWISVEEAKKLLSEGGRLVDVRSMSEFSLNHLPGAINIPVSNIGQRSQELEPLDKPIILYCKSGMRSSQAQKVLEKKGFTQVHNLGSYARWQ